MRKIFFQTLIVIVSVAVLSELVLRYKGMYATYSEANGGTYVTEYGQTYPDWYHTHHPSDTFTPTVADFHYPYNINSLGIRDSEHTVTKPDGIFRIVIFGDSYTEGVGAPTDSTWATLIQKYATSKTNKQIEVMNAGVSGCDPYFNYVMYRDKISRYNPDLVIASVNVTDYSDIMLRGRMERFKPNGTTQYARGPWYEKLFEHSRLFRAILHKMFGFDLTGIFISRHAYKNRLTKINQDILHLFSQFKDTVQTRGSKFVVLLYTIPPEIVYQKHKITEYNSESLKKLSALIRTNRLETIDLRDDLYKRYHTSAQQTYTYVSDLHYRPSGYAAIAYMITDTLVKRNLIYSQFYSK